MKYLITVLTIIFSVSSCCGTKEVVKSQPEETEEIVEITKPGAPDVPETPIVEPLKETEIEVENEIEKASEVEIDTFKQTHIKKTFPIHQLWDDLLKKHVSDNGVVDYKAFKTEHKNLLGYIHVLSLLYSKEGFQTLSKEEKLAYWINSYNAMTIDLILRNPSVKSIKDIKDPWNQRLWKLGSKWYNLDEIEHQILREMNEPRIHFAIVCASVSCPKLQNEAFTASNLESQLTNATKEFLSDSSKNNISRNKIKLSKIFKWFAKDFKKNQSLIDFLNKYSDIEISQNASKSYKDYNWNLND